MVINVPPAPSVTPPSPNEWPQDLIKPISGITQDSQAIVTVTNHGFTSADVGITTVMFLQVLGMRQINGLPGRITAVIDANNFQVNINTTNFYPYRGAGVISIVTGEPPSETASFQIFNTPFQNIA